MLWHDVATVTNGTIPNVLASVLKRKKQRTLCVPAKELIYRLNLHKKCADLVITELSILAHYYKLTMSKIYNAHNICPEPAHISAPMRKRSRCTMATFLDTDKIKAH